jgi:hypothetical protein
VSGVLDCRLGDENGVHRGESSQHDRDDQQDLIFALSPGGEADVEQVEVGRSG